jgi:hypothetical protein
MCSIRHVVFVIVFAVGLCFATSALASGRLLVSGEEKCLGWLVLPTPSSKLAQALPCEDEKVTTGVVISAIGEIRVGSWCLGIRDANADETHYLNWSRCTGTANLLWTVEQPGAALIIRNLMNDWCLTHGGKSTRTQRCDGRKAQQWRHQAAKSISKK